MKMVLPVFEVGEYKIKYDLGIHKTPGLSCNRLPKYLKAGEYAEVEHIKYLKHSVWGKIKEGWILLYMNGTKYVIKK